jgi:hypothetical protein
MRKCNQLSILVLTILLILVMAGICSAARKTDKTFSEKKCTRLKGEVTDKYYGKTHNGKICLFQFAPDRGATLCNDNWRNCEFHPLKVTTRRRGARTTTTDHPANRAGCTRSVTDKRGGTSVQLTPNNPCPDLPPTGANNIVHTNPNPTQTKDCKPGPREVAFFEHGWNSKCSVRTVGNYPTERSLGVAKNEVSRIRVGSQVQAYICTKQLYGGKCVTYKRDIILGGNHGKVRNNELSSAKVQDRVTLDTDCNPSPNQVALFKDSNWVGTCVVLDIGQYKNAFEMGITGDTISSFHLGSNVRLIAHVDSNFQGRSRTFDTSFTYLPTNNCYLGFWPCRSNQWGNTISSVQVIRK